MTARTPGASAPGDESIRRGLRGERGTAFVAALVVMFAVTGMAAVWLARDVNRRVSDRSALQSVAFQAARAGAQQLEVGELRDAGSARVAIDAPAARSAARTAALRLGTSYDLDVQIVSQGFGDDRATWIVRLAVAAAGDEMGDADLVDVLTATGIARAEAGG